MYRGLQVFSFFLLLGVCCGSEVCHVGDGRSAATRSHCGGGGCAVVSFSDEENGGIAQYRCLKDLHRHHPIFVTLPCAHSTLDATCYSRNSFEPLPNNIRRLGVREQTYGEVLTTTGIEKFCCCRGEYCNSANEKIRRHFHQSNEFADELPASSSAVCYRTSLTSLFALWAVDMVRLIYA